MRDELRNVLIKVAPDLYAHDPEISCGDGWYEPILKASVSLQVLIDLGTDFYAEQVKEKFGGLRLYVNLYNEEIDEIIKTAEAECWKTCEDCGTTENVSTEGPGWIRTLCVQCRD